MGTVILLILLGIVVYAIATRGSRSSESGSARELRRVRGRGADSGLTLSIELEDGAGYRAPRARARQVPPAELARAGDRVWVPPGAEVRVGAFTIPGGMIYLGEDLPPIGGWHEREPALIDPSLPVARRNPDLAGEAMSYWPSYSEIPGECRAAYLGWLAEGRSDPGAYIGYVFLFLYGLERRLLFDLRHLPERKGEIGRLLGEVERLLSLYPENRSFQGYGTSLLHSARALWQGDRAYEREPSFGPSSNGAPPIDVLLAVGQLATAGKPIPGEWALAWVVGHPETRLRTPARRCWNEFRELFLRRFEERYGVGMPLKPNKRRLRISHNAASASFGGPVEICFDDLPDVSGLSRPLRVLREIAEAASSDLESYSRFVGRQPENATSLQALALLPAELAGGRRGAEAERLRAWIESTLGDRPSAVVATEDVMSHWPCGRGDRMSKSEVASLSRVLESMGCGIEPDPRFGGGAYGANQKASVFRLGSDRPSAATPTYRAATLLLHLTAAVAASDGEVSQEEERHLEEHLERSMHLSEGETRRLRAHLQWLLASAPSLSGLKRRIEGIDERGRQDLAQFAVAIAGADGVIPPEEVNALGKIYRLLGLDPDQAYGDIHSLKTSAHWSPADRPVTVRPPEEVDAGYAISAPPAPSPPPAGTFSLDMDRIEKTLADTAAVSSVLTEIFADQEGGEPPSTVETESTAGLAGLDAAHTQLLRALQDRAELSREQFEEIAEGLGLLADGAFEMLNEAAFEHADAPLLEGDDLVSVDRGTLGEMMR